MKLKPHNHQYHLHIDTNKIDNISYKLNFKSGNCQFLIQDSVQEKLYSHFASSDSPTLADLGEKSVKIVHNFSK